MIFFIAFVILILILLLIYLNLLSVFSFILAFVLIFSQLLLNDQIIIGLVSHNKDLAVFFSTSAAVIASLTAIFFSVSLAFIQIWGDKNGLNLLEITLKIRVTVVLLVSTFVIMLFSLFCILINLCSFLFGIFVFIGLLIWVRLFYLYLKAISKLFNDYELSIFILDWFKKSIDNNSIKDIDKLLVDIRRTVFNSIKNEDTDTRKIFETLLYESYFYSLEKGNCSVKKLIIHNYLLISKKLLDKNNDLFLVRYLVFFEIPYHEIKDKSLNNKDDYLDFSRIDFEFLDYYFNNFLFNLNQCIVNLERKKSFSEEITQYSLSLLGTFSDNDSHVLYYTFRSIEKPEEIDSETFLDISMRFENFGNCFSDIIAFNFEDAREIDKKIDTFSKDLKDSIGHKDVENLGEIYNKFKFATIDSLLEKYITLKNMKLFFIVGSYITYRFERKPKVLQKYLKILWDITNCRDLRVHYLNTSPITCDLSLLTKIYLFGGEGNNYWQKSSKIKFKDYIDVGKYIDQYYILSVTWILDNKNVSGLPKFSFNDYEVPELRELILKFCLAFNRSHDEMLKLCDDFIAESTIWNKLFAEPKSAFEDTKIWIANTSKHCQEKYLEILVKIDLAPKKIEEVEDHIILEYNKLKENENISEFKSVLTNKEREFKRIGSENKFRRENFIDFDLNTFNIYKYNFSHICEDIFKSHFNEVINSLTCSKELQKYSETLDDPNSFEDFVCSAYKQMKSEGFIPKMILMPNKLQPKLIMGIKDWTKVNCEYQDLPIICFYDNPVNSLFLVDPSAAVFEYEKKKGGKILEIKVDDIKDKINPTLRVNMGYLFEIVKPRGIMEIKISEELLKD